MDDVNHDSDASVMARYFMMASSYMLEHGSQSKASLTMQLEGKMRMDLSIQHNNLLAR